MPGTTRPGSRSRHLTYFASVDGSALGSATPSAVGPTPRTAIASAVGPAAAATSADGPVETPTTGTGRVRPSRTFENGVEPGSGTSSGRTTRTLGRSSSSIKTSRAVQTTFCMALRPLLNAYDPNSYIRSSPIAVRETAARLASPVSCPRQICWARTSRLVRIFSPRSARSRIRLLVSSAILSLPSSSLIRCSRFARDFLSGATSRRWISSPSLAQANRLRAMRSSTRAVDHPLVFSGGGAVTQILVSRAAGGSSPCFINTSITSVVDPDPSRRGRPDDDCHHRPFGRILLSQVISGGLEGFVERFAEKSKLLAATVVELVQMVKDALEHMYDDINFKVVLEAGEKLLVMARDGIQAPVQPCTQHDDSFWANPDNIAAVEEIENAIIMKQGLMDRPSFSLGLTQTPVVSPGGGVQDIVAGCTVVRNGGCPFSLVDGVIQDEATVDLLQLGDIEISGNVVPTVAVDGNNTADLITPPPQILRCCTKSLSDTIAIAQLKTPLKVAQPHSKASLKVGDDAWDMPSFSLGLTQSLVVLPTENVQKSGMDCTVARSTECPSGLKVGAVQFAAMVNPPLLGKIEVYGRKIPIEGELDGDMEPHNTDVDKSTADDDAVKELDEMEKRLKEMEEEAGGVLREMQAKVKKEMDAVQNPASDAASFSGKQGGS
nr:polyadenylate-binding protein 2 [Ipomoea batatas]